MKYHRQAYGLPKFNPFVLQLRYSQHAQDRIHEKNIESVPQTLNSRDCTVFEIEDTDVRKFALRKYYNQVYDLCIVVDETGLVRTVWLNKRTDKHTTLNKKLYAKPLP